MMYGDMRIWPTTGGIQLVQWKHCIHWTKYGRSIQHILASSAVNINIILQSSFHSRWPRQFRHNRYQFGTNFWPIEWCQYFGSGLRGRSSHRGKYRICSKGIQFFDCITLLIAIRSFESQCHSHRSWWAGHSSGAQPPRKLSAKFAIRKTHHIRKSVDWSAYRTECWQIRCGYCVRSAGAR